jgi:4-hydroxy-4-methyl-2-oxoglutarate aldolase
MNVADSADPLTSVCERLRKLPTAVISDVLAAMGLYNQVVSSSVRAVTAPRTIAGPALCLLGKETSEPPRGDAARAAFEMDRYVKRGCIAVIATGGHKIGATIGGNVALSWQFRGCAGVVSDGGIRDLQEFMSLDLPVFASFVGPMSNKGLWYFTEIEVPITLPGQTGVNVSVNPGDLVHADADGVVIIPSAVRDQAVQDGEIVEQAEARIRSELQTGEDRETVYARHNRFAHIKKFAAS